MRLLIPTVQDGFSVSVVEGEPLERIFIVPKAGELEAIDRLLQSPTLKSTAGPLEIRRDTRLAYDSLTRKLIRDCAGGAETKKMFTKLRNEQPKSKTLLGSAGGRAETHPHTYWTSSSRCG